YRLKSSMLLNGPPPKLLPLRTAGRRRASSVNGGARPSAGSTSSPARRFFAFPFSNPWTGLVPGEATEGSRRSRPPRLALLTKLTEFLLRHVVELLAFELIRALERDAAFVVVCVHAGQIRITPGRPRRRVGLGRFRECRSLRLRRLCRSHAHR